MFCVYFTTYRPTPAHMWHLALIDGGGELSQFNDSFKMISLTSQYFVHPTQSCII